jgi:hypothetical protein
MLIFIVVCAKRGAVLQAFERLRDGLGLARQVEDQRAVANHRDLARQDRRRHEAQADLPHLLAEARHLLVRHGQRRFGRDVAQRGAGAAGGQHQRAAGIDQLDQRGADGGLFVGNQPGLEVDRIAQGASQPVLQCGQALVFVHAGGGAVADRDDADADGVEAHGGLAHASRSRDSSLASAARSLPAWAASCARTSWNTSR